MFVYVIVNHTTLKIYIGQHKGASLKQYLQRKLSAAAHYEAGGSYLFASMRKHPKEAWSIHSLVSGIESKAELDDVEKHFIRCLRAQHPTIGYNICAGGEGASGHQLSSETRAKIGAAHRGLKHTPEAIARMCAVHQKIAEPLRGVPRPPEFMVGCQTPEAREKRTQALRGRTHTATAKQHMSEGKRQEWATRKNRNFSAKRNSKIAATMRGRTPEAALMRAHDPEVEARRQLTRVIKTVAWG